jgi:hypothetical protein
MLAPLMRYTSLAGGMYCLGGSRKSMVARSCCCACCGGAPAATPADVACLAAAAATGVAAGAPGVRAAGWPCFCLHSSCSSSII